MTLQEFNLLKEGQLLTIRNQHGLICDIIHYNKHYELRHHNYCGEDYYFLGITLCPRLSSITLTTDDDITEFYIRKKELYDNALSKILNLRNEL